MAVCVGIQPYGGYGLRYYRGPGSSFHSHAQTKHQGKVEPDVEDNRYQQKYQWYDRIAYGTEQKSIEVVDADRYHAQKDDKQIAVGHLFDFGRCLQQADDRSQKGQRYNVEQEGDTTDNQHGGKDAAPHGCQIACAILHGEHSAASHAKTDKDRRHKYDEGIRRAYRGQCLCTQYAANDKRIGNVVALL